MRSMRSTGVLLAALVALFSVVRLMTTSRAKTPVATRASEPVQQQPVVNAPASPAPSKGSGRGFRAVGLAVATAVMVAAMGAGAVLAADESPDFTVAHDPQAPLNMNETAFWEAYLATNYGGTWDCGTKFSLTTDPVVLANDVDALIIKAGTNNYGWVPAPAGDYSPPENSTSHYFICDTDTVVEDDIIDPAADIRGPCADPAYFAVFDNTASTVAITFRFRWYNFNGLNIAKKTVPAGSYFITTQKWVRAYRTMRIGYKDPLTNIWKTLVSEQSGKGRYPACTAETHGYIPGFGTGTVPADPSQNL